MKLAAAAVVVALTAFNCAAGSERALLDQFFAASRLRDRSALARSRPSSSNHSLTASSKSSSYGRRRMSGRLTIADHPTDLPHAQRSATASPV